MGSLAVALWGCRVIGETAFIVGLFVVAVVLMLWAAALAATDGAGDEGQ